MQHKNILVFPCGSEVGLEINKSLKDISFITLFGGSSVSDHGLWEYENYIPNIPYITDNEFIDKLNAILDKYNIDYILPALDAVVLKLSEVRDSLHAEVLTSSKEAVDICRSKKKTYEKLKGLDFLPIVYKSPNDVHQYPVLMKPAVGQGAQGVKKVFDREELEFELAHREEEQVVCEFLPGTEYTVDCFTDRNGRLLFASHRSRRRIKNGISVNSFLEPKDERIQKIAEEINERMKFRGVWFFQVKKNAGGEYRLMECATRVAGTMCVERARGVNLPLLTVFDFMGYDVTIDPQFDYVETDRALSNDYDLNFKYDELYIDYDDTIIVHDRVNESVMALLYRCENRGIPVYLVTKHDGNIIKSLQEKKIMPELFAKIIHLDKKQVKKDFIHPSTHALYLDDSFAERREIGREFGIRTMGVDMVEVLLNGVRM